MARNGSKWDDLDFYINLCRKNYVSLTKEDEIELAKRIGEGDRGAKEKLFRSKLFFPIKLSSRFVGRGLNRMDLIQEGNIGLLRAVEEFEPWRGRFSTCAYQWIGKAIRMALPFGHRGDELPGVIGFSYGLAQQFQTWVPRLDEYERKYQEEYGGYPDNKQLADYMRTSKKTVWTLRKARLAKDSPLYGSISDDGKFNINNHLYDKNAPPVDEIAAKREAIERLKTLLNGYLSDRERDIVLSRSEEGRDDSMKLRDIGVCYGISRERVRQIRNRAREKLRGGLDPTGTNEFAYF